ncbi:MAG TPA: NAD-dependent malic enzyme [Desulfopila sp.]|nr:NAD-dependent malic enzyme [Desulfopila sp.]
MAANQYRFKYDEYGNTREILVYESGPSVHANSFINKGTAFSVKERKQLGIEAVLPPSVRDLESQVEATQSKVEARKDGVDKFRFIRELFDRNVTLAHAVIQSDIEKYIPIIYTPTVELAVQQYSSMFRKANGIYLYPGNINNAEDILRRYAHRDIRIAVVTDNQGVLGVGDQGVGGIAICLGKLMLYTQGAGIAPWHCLPISLDVGTNNESLLADKEYLGWRHERLQGEEYLQFIGRFARAFRNVFPHAVCQWEDFSKQNAFSTRDAFADELISFNEDIQGTGAIVLASILTAMKIKRQKLREQIFLIHGAGTCGIGVAEQIELALIEEGLSADEAKKRIFALDSKGILWNGRECELYKRKYATDPGTHPWVKEDILCLEDVIEHCGATVLVGTSGQGGCVGCFTQEVIEAVANNTDRPVILPLSNPETVIEADPAEIYQWTGGKAVVATGSSFGPFQLEGKIYTARQASNVLIFPGIGAGILASGAREVLPQFFTAAARAVSDCVSDKEMEVGCLVPRLAFLKHISLKVAQAVAMCAVNRGVSRPCVFSDFQHENDEQRMKELIRRMRWEPDYLPLVAM